MQITLKNLENVTADKVEFIEKQATELLKFVLESRSLLTKEAHTTLNWIFAIIIGSSGYAYKLLDSETPRWWLVCPLIVAATLAGIQGLILFHGALRNVPILPIGNDPKNLATDTFMAYEVHWMRLAEACQLQERIDDARDHNGRVGDVINKTRWAIASVPIIACAVAAITKYAIAALG